MDEQRHGAEGAGHKRRTEEELTFRRRPSRHPAGQKAAVSLLVTEEQEGRN